jgi:hypothetical protein
MLPLMMRLRKPIELGGLATPEKTALLPPLASW